MGRRINFILILGIIMPVGAIFFLTYALNHPQASFPWSNHVTYLIYTFYIVAMILSLSWGFKRK